MRSKVIGYGWGLLLLSGCQIGMGPPSYIPERALQPSITVPVISPALTSPVPSPSVSVGGGVTVPLQPAHSATPAGNDSQQSPQASSSTGSAPVVSGVLSGSGSSGGSASTVEPGFYISDVVLTETGESIMGADSPAVLSSNYTDSSPILITLKGQFKTEPALTEPLMRFTYEPGLLHQTFTGEEPTAHVLINKSILLEPLTVGLREIRLQIQGQFLADLQEDGLHTIEISAHSMMGSQQIRIKNPLPAVLLPEVDNVKAFSQNGKKWLKVTGSHFFVNPLKNQIIWQGQALSIQFSEVRTTGKSTLWALIPELGQPQIGDTVIMSTPFGTTPGEINDVQN